MSGQPFRRIAAALASLLLLAGCVTKPVPPVAAKVPPPPPAPREFRAVWVATVANIDWPSKPGLPVAQQKSELIAILDRARALKLNAVILQVRPAADALYASEFEPWSEYLTGKQGGSPGYDPLVVWVEEAHRRGLELHAWFNPYRARHDKAKSEFAPNHLAKTHPASVRKYGDYWWMDPGDEFAVKQTLAVVADVVRRYDIDGVHIDDYFYPYPIPAPLPKGAKLTPGEPAPEVDFPDDPSWQRYVKSGGKLARADWRRDNVDRLVEQLYRTVHGVKPWVKFGISPFGIGRPDRRPPGVTGFSQYDKLYADAELWLQQGWLDYFAPQLYWRIGQKGQDFGTLLDYWARQNTRQRHVWPGLFTSAIGDTPKGWTPEDILRQISLIRADPRFTGHIQYSMVALLEDRHGIAQKLQASVYPDDALVPATPWLDATPPAAPLLKRQKSGAVAILPTPGKPVASYAIWRQEGGAWKFSVLPAGAKQNTTKPTENAGVLSVVDRSLEPTGIKQIAATPTENVVVSAVDRLGNESARVTLPGIAAH